MAYIDQYGVRFSDDKKVLEKCPKDFQGAYTIPDSVTEIKSYAFCYCSGLTSIDIPNSVTTIGDWAFRSCSCLTSIIIPSSVTKIGAYAFYDCTKITSVTWNAKNCNTYNFGNRIESFTFGDEVEVIPGELCKEMSELTSISIPYSITKIGGGSFEGCTGLTSIMVDCKNPIYDSRDNCNAIILTKENKLIVGCKNTIIPNSITEIGSCAFKGCSSLTSIEIPNSVTTIGNWAFEDCSHLTSITIPNSVTSIGEETFDGCKSLPIIDNIRYADTYLLYAIDCGTRSSYIIKNGTRWIGKYAFSTVFSEFSVTIPNSVTEIGRYAFEGCIGLTSINIPASVIEIGENAFHHCASLPTIDNIRYADTYLIEAVDKSLKTYTIKDGTKIIGECAFLGCTNLTSINIPNSVLKIGDAAFRMCTNLTSIKIPNSVVEIGLSVFMECTGLVSINIPNSVTEIGDGVFDDCKSLPIIDNIRYADTYLIEAVDKSLSTYHIKEGTKVIGSSAFEGCSNLTSIEIPNSVMEIRWCAFRGCTILTSIEIPNSVRWIGGYVFQGCTNLTSIKILDLVTRICGDNFDGCTNLREIIVPFGQKDRFSKMEGLRGLENKIIERDHEKIIVLLNLAKAYEKGIGVSQDRGQAFMFYKQAAEAGSKEAQQWMQERELEE